MPSRNFILAYLVFLFFLLTYHPADPDLWGHLKWGKMMIEERRLPSQNLQSYTAYGYPWINYSWLSNLILATISHFWGSAALILWKVLLLFSLVFFVTLNLSSFSSSFALILFYNLATSLLLASFFRPQLFGFFFFALLLCCLKKKNYFSLPFLFLFWANMHPSFTGGLIYWLFLMLLEKLEKQSQRASFLFFFLSLFSTLINPYGFYLWKAIIGTSTSASFKQYVAEWRSPFYAPQLFFFICPALFLLLFLARKRKLAPSSFSFLPFFFLTLSSFRFYAFLMIAMTFSLTDLIRSSPLFLSKKQDLALKTFCHLFFATSFFFSLPRHKTITYTSYQMPYDCLVFMKKNHIQGNLFSEWSWGEYLLFHLSPQIKIAYDGRLNTAYPFSTLEELFSFQYASKRHRWEKETDYYLFRTGSKAAKRAQKTFFLLYQDKTASLYSRVPRKTKPLRKKIALRSLPFP